MFSADGGSVAATEDESVRQRELLVLIGLSAGGVTELFTVLDALPPHIKFPIVIILHLHPDYKSVMVDLLARRTHRQVKVVAEGHPQPGTVYVAPPDQHVVFDHGRMGLTHTAPIHHARPSIDVAFESAAHDGTFRVIAVLLSGAGSDGAAGMSVVKAAGGTTIAQLPETALFRSMPNSAISAGCVDFVLPSSKIATLLQDLAA